MNIKIKKLNENAVIPKYSRIGDAGLDLIATSIERNDNYIEYGTGLAIEIPEGYVGLLFPRSSVSNYDLVQANSVGVIDCNYRGEVKVRFKCTATLKSPYYMTEKLYNMGDKIGQLLIVPYPEIVLEESEELSDTNRGSNGFGSSGV
jgi:dUTP pyrophosphatase